jgi:putative heme-binding domain-containing protein
MRVITPFALVLLAAGTLLAQHGAPPPDVQSGTMLYQRNCSVCHGPNGDTVAGVDLWSGKFRRVSTDSEITGIMRNGIPDKGMPPANLTDTQAGQILAYLRFEAAEAARVAALPGNPANGRAIFEGKGACLNCHRVAGRGSRAGPDLSDIASQRRSPEELERSILEPNADINPQNRFVYVVLVDGSRVKGRLLNHDAFSLQLLDSEERLRSFQKSKLREFEFEKTSLMPSYQGKLTGAEIADLVVYLLTLKGITP